jgi:DNA invertase Pin-like site-specific DNA recombinase
MGDKMIYGYCRVSTIGQDKDGNSLIDQKQIIEGRYPDAKIVSETISGAKKERPIFDKLLLSLQTGDTLVVTKLDRFCRATKEGLEYIDFLMSKGVSVHILNMGLIDDTPTGRLMVTMLLAFAEFERSMIKERTEAGKAVARAQGKKTDGRYPKDTRDIEKFLKKQKDGLITVKECCKELGISRTLWYNRVRERGVRFDESART